MAKEINFKSEPVTKGQCSSRKTSSMSWLAWIPKYPLQLPIILLHCRRLQVAYIARRFKLHTLPASSSYIPPPSRKKFYALGQFSFLWLPHSFNVSVIWFFTGVIASLPSEYIHWWSQVDIRHQYIVVYIPLRCKYLWPIQQGKALLSRCQLPLSAQTLLAISSLEVRAPSWTPSAQHNLSTLLLLIIMLVRT
jgi:hypothetical protein